MSDNGLLGGDGDGKDDDAAGWRGKFFWLDTLLAGESKHREGYLFDALVKYQQLAKRSSIPRSVNHAVRVRIGQTSAVMFSAVEALHGFKDALAFDTESHVAYFHTGLMMVRQSRFNEAEQAFRTAVFYRNDDVKSLHMLASLAFLRGREQEALYFFKSALAKANQLQLDGTDDPIPMVEPQGQEMASRFGKVIAAHILRIFAPKGKPVSPATSRALQYFVDRASEGGADELVRHVARWCAEALLHHGSHELARDMFWLLQDWQSAPDEDNAVVALRWALLLPRAAASDGEHYGLMDNLEDQLQQLSERSFVKIENISAKVTCPDSQSSKMSRKCAAAFFRVCSHPSSSLKAAPSVGVRSNLNYIPLPSSPPALILVLLLYRFHFGHGLPC